MPGSRSDSLTLGNMVGSFPRRRTAAARKSVS
jgi:hypothetical protein